MRCIECEGNIDTYDVGAFQKFVDKSAKKYMCRKCLAKHMGWSDEYLEELILFYRRRGCLLFPPLDEEV